MSETRQPSPSAPDVDRYSAPALDKGLDILEALSDESAGYTLNELTKALGRNVNQIFRMVVTLERRGYIVCDDNGRYTLSLKLFRLAHRQPPVKRLTQLALPLLNELAQRAHQSCHLAIYQSGRVVVLAQADNPDRWSFGLKVGALMGLTDTSSGHVLLAYHDDVARARMLSSHIRVEGELTVDPAELYARLDGVRSSGYAQMESAQIRGVTNTAFPVLGLHNQIIAVINVPHLARIDTAPGPTFAQVQRIQADICARLSRALGAHVDG